MARQFFGRLKILKSQRFLYSALGIILCLIGVYVWDKYKKAPTEFRQTEVREWAIGLLFPAIVGGGGYWLNQQAEKRTDKEQDQREEEAKRERLEQREQNDLKYYFDRISTLVVENGLTKSHQESEQYQIARALTANILRELTGEKMNQVMFFLYSLKLSGRVTNPQNGDRAISVLKEMQLSGANLEYLNGEDCNFRKSNFEKANLQGACLFDAQLQQTVFKEAILDECDLSRAKFGGANLINAKLINANLWGADLRDVLLDGANLNGASLNYSNLINADLSRANLSYANLSYANLGGTSLINADLSYADLSYAKLINANLWRADLGGAKLDKTELSEPLTEEQQKQCEIYQPIIVESEGDL